MMRLWGHTPDPRHSLHSLLRRSCSHICDPPHSLHWLLRRLWGQMPDPRHSLHWLLRRSCSHICDPPHSLHSLLRRLCSHLPEGILAGSASANWVSLGCSPGRTDDQRVFTARSPQNARRRSVQARRGRTSCALHASTSVCVVVPVLNLSPDASQEGSSASTLQGALVC